jgi:hypothetical protein
VIPDAVAAAIQGALDANPTAERSSLGRLIARELRREGWSVVAPVTGRPTTTAVDGPSEVTR